MDHLLELLKTWGYIVVLLGSMVEGESIILTACVAAYFGYMSMPKIVVIAFLGTLIADQSLYFIGRRYGHRILNRYPKLKTPAHRAFTLLHRWDFWFILSFRFIYGIRTISPIIIGTAGIPPRRFIPLNFLAAVIWTAASCSLGYVLGGIIESIDFHIVERYLLIISLTLLAILITIGYIGWRKLHPHHKTPLPSEEQSNTAPPPSCPSTQVNINDDHHS